MLCNGTQWPQTLGLRKLSGSIKLEDYFNWLSDAYLDAKLIKLAFCFFYGIFIIIMGSIVLLMSKKGYNQLSL